MSERTAQIIRNSGAAPSASQAGTVRRIRFVRGAHGSSTILRKFGQPEAAVAIETPVESTTIEAADTWPEPADKLDVLIMPASQSPAAEEQIETFLKAQDHPDAPRTVVVRLKCGTIHWRPGRAVIQAGRNQAEQMLPGLIDFSFYESELRRLEHALEPTEVSAKTDVALAYDVRHADRREWPRLKSTMESLYTMRLTFARLEPQLGEPPRSLDEAARRVFARLASRAGVEHRLESFSDRLETCEDLYEGAIDRASDFRWYRKGNLLEITIVILLAGEAILLLIDLFLRFRELFGE